jgi:hypothetical protein
LPLKALALRFPIRFITSSADEPCSVKRELSASKAALSGIAIDPLAMIVDEPAMAISPLPPIEPTSVNVTPVFTVTAVPLSTVIGPELPSRVLAELAVNWISPAPVIRPPMITTSVRSSVAPLST